jgi:TRAP-type C4-dicarboxylate transport system permease small subunit
MTVLIAPYLLRKGQHIRLDVVLVSIPRYLGWMFEVAGDIIGIAICAIFFRYSLFMTVDSWKSQSLTIKNLVFPEWWLLAPLPFVFGLLTIEFCFRLQRLFDGERKPRQESTSAA